MSAALLLLLAALTLAHYWPGRGLLTYVGLDIHPRQFDFNAPSSFPLAQPRNDLPGLPNFGRVSADLYRGGQPTREGFKKLRQMGVRTVVSLREFKDDEELLEGTGLRYVRLRFNPAEPTNAAVASFLRLVRDPQNLPIFVHCAAGSDRTGTMVAIYRVMEQGWPMREAIKELPRFDFHEVWSDILEYLARFDPETMNRIVSSKPPPPTETP